MRPDDGAWLRCKKTGAGEKERREGKRRRSRMAVEVCCRKDAKKKGIDDDLLVTEAVAQIAADETADGAAREKQGEDEPRNELGAAAFDEKERQEDGGGKMRPAAQPHGKIEPEHGTAAQNRKQRGRLSGSCFLYGGIACEPFRIEEE